ncbi:hypothetical protein AMELA_G00191770 [Ameiurus melas]|uniref:Uncharacterized protein n=1 Tax=Ameiurus melas TaxID=219545 RepID=A0A7J6A8X3_AMEME|nr:hypothetical protein AMELA_G00191770 [Ameiurus melas]
MTFPEKAALMLLTSLGNSVRKFSSAAKVRRLCRQLLQHVRREQEVLKRLAPRDVCIKTLDPVLGQVKIAQLSQFPYRL